ncbi:MAG: substrate-binding domain-containing protein [Schwartzia sp.]|nr:substrate-binding domain-containing protein [Schwartzia sp. (in: firmicutes)]
MTFHAKKMGLAAASVAAAAFVVCPTFFSSAGSGADAVAERSEATAGEEEKEEPPAPERSNSVHGAVDFDHVLDSYKPRKDRYNFYFTYKIVHPWWDAVALGMEEAQRQYLARGITVTYEYMAPNAASAADQTERLRAAEQGGYDVIGVDVADEAIISPIIDEMVDSGYRVMTFSSSDAAEGCKRIAYVGNTHNYRDGADLTEALCEKLDYEGEVAILVGSKGAPCHEDRAKGAMDTIAKYGNMKIAAIEYDMDSVEIAHELALKILREHPNLSGFVCCNMSNPVGTARAVTETGSGAVIVGMDHDREALHYLQDGVIYCLGVQDCYSIGFDTVQAAVKIADGNLPGELFPEKQDETTTIIYRKDADLMLALLYGDIS